jgi:hypothetical protein
VGNRSNINFITQQKDDTVIGLNVYSHWGGIEAQLAALEAADGPAYERRRSHDGFFVRCVARAATRGSNGPTGAGFNPFVVSDLMKGYGYISDNQHIVLAFDLINQLVVLTEGCGKDKPTVITKFPLDHAGIRQAKRGLTNPECPCPACAWVNSDGHPN